MRVLLLDMMWLPGDCASWRVLWVSHQLPVNDHINNSKKKLSLQKRTYKVHIYRWESEKDANQTAF